MKHKQTNKSGKIIKKKLLIFYNEKQKEELNLLKQYIDMPVYRYQENTL